MVDSADVFAKSDLDLGKFNIIKHAIKITDPQPFKECYRRIPPHLYEEVKKHLQEMVEVGQLGGASALGPLLWCWLEKKMGAEVLH